MNVPNAMSPDFSTDLAKLINEDEYQTKQNLKLKNTIYFKDFIFKYQILLEQDDPKVKFSIDIKVDNFAVLHQDILKRLHFLFDEDSIVKGKTISQEYFSTKEFQNSNEKGIFNEFRDFIERITMILNYHFESSFENEISPKDNLSNEERNLKQLEKRYLDYLQEPVLEKTFVKMQRKNWAQKLYVCGKKLRVFK